MRVIKTVRSGALALAIREYADGRYGFDYLPPAGERIRVRLRDLDRAAERARELIGVTQAGKIDLLAIDPEEFAAFLRWKASRARHGTVPEIVTAYLASKERGELSTKYLEDIRGTLTPFSESFPIAIDRLTRRHVEEWLDACRVGARRWNNQLAHIVGLIRYARTEGFVPAERSPVEFIERKKTSAKKETYTVAELKALLAAVPIAWAPAVILGAFGGIRPQEICPEYSKKEPLRWENFLWAKSVIDLPARVSKVGRRRFVPLGEAALDFLTPWRFARGPVVPRQKMSNMTSRWGIAAKVPWKSDGLRHSYASYRLALTKNIHALSDEMGNSPKMIHDHYLDRKHEDEALEWFALRRADIRRPGGWNILFTAA